jgi:lactoylglutathione lyase
MKLDHVAIWTDNLESLKDYYVTHFNGTSNNLYENPTTQFKSYFNPE